MENTLECYQGPTTVEGIAAEGVEEETVFVRSYCDVVVCGLYLVCKDCTLWGGLLLQTELRERNFVMTIFIPLVAIVPYDYIMERLQRLFQGIPS